MFKRSIEEPTSRPAGLAERRGELEAIQKQLGELQAAANATHSVRQEQQARVDRLHVDGQALLAVTDAEVEAAEARLRQAMRAAATAQNALTEFERAHAGLEAELEALRVAEMEAEQATARESYRETLGEFLAAGHALTKAQTALEVQYRTALRTWRDQRVLPELGFAQGFFTGSEETFWSQVREHIFDFAPGLFEADDPTRRRLQAAKEKAESFNAQLAAARS
jgi:DNA repair exonuclease SbcCD ATPase subunit